MINNRFAVLLAERRIRTTTVHKATGISRTTLTALWYGRGEGIEYGTLAKLCAYLGCQVGDIFEYVPDPPSE